MTDEKKYVDANSGAAPQPGGYAGVEASKKGFAVPQDAELDEEFSPTEYEAPGGTGSATGGYSVDEAAKAAEKRKGSGEEEKSEEEKQRLQALANPRQVLADLDESENEHDVPEAGSEEKAVNDAALEHEAVDLNQAGEEGSYDPSQYSVEEVNAYLSENPDQRDAVVAAEKSGKGRKGITGE